jgi:hypothetical protein
VSTGAREVAGTEVSVYQLPELVPDDILEKSGAKAARAAFAGNAPGLVSFRCPFRLGRNREPPAFESPWRTRRAAVR